ncbi:MAG TPA: hypothetical protein VFB50_21840, partial [Chloroflexota bacterium]|nr:hypothetical protein [Chloroflexota bacterium]
GRAAQPVHRLAEAKLYGKHDEFEHVATDTTSEAPPGLGGGEHMQIWTTAVCVKWTPTDERAPLPFELDSIPSDNIFDRVGMFQRSGVNPSCSGPDVSDWMHPYLLGLCGQGNQLRWQRV